MSRNEIRADLIPFVPPGILQLEPEPLVEAAAPLPEELALPNPANLEEALEEMHLNAALRARLETLGWSANQLDLLLDFEGEEAFVPLLIGQIVMNESQELLGDLRKERVDGQKDMLENQRLELEALSQVIFLPTEEEPQQCPLNFDPSVFLSKVQREANRARHFQSISLLATAELDTWLASKGWDRQTIDSLSSETVDGFIDRLIVESLQKWDLEVLQSMPKEYSDRIQIIIRECLDDLEKDLTFLNSLSDEPQ